MQFGTAMTFVSLWEWRNRPDGALHTDPSDSGGTTKYGISQKWHPQLDVKSLTLQQAFDVYKNEYWNNCNCDHIPSGMDMCVFDAAITSGVGVALKWYKLYPTDVRGYLETRRHFLIGLNNPAEINGWMNRVNDLAKFITINQ